MKCKGHIKKDGPDRRQKAGRADVFTLSLIRAHGPRVKPPSIRWTLGSESRVEARGRSEVSLTQQGKSALRIFGEGNKD